MPCRAALKSNWLARTVLPAPGAPTIRVNAGRLTPPPRTASSPVIPLANTASASLIRLFPLSVFLNDVTSAWKSGGGRFHSGYTAYHGSWMPWFAARPTGAGAPVARRYRERRVWLPPPRTASQPPEAALRTSGSVEPRRFAGRREAG